MKAPVYKTSQEAHEKTRKVRIGWAIYFIVVIICTFCPLFYPYHAVDPMILGIPVHLFKWFLCTIALIGGIIVFEFTTFWKLRGDDR